MKNALRALTFVLATQFILIDSTHASSETKGLLPEVRLNSDNEEKNQETAFQSEVMITKAEAKAVESLQKILVKKKGAKDEPDLYYRLAELYMRRARSGRFFDLADRADARLTKAGVQNDKTQDSLKSAIKIYNKLETEFPKFKYLDGVFFNSALAHQQTQQIPRAQELYNKLVEQFPKSPLVPDALLEVGELYYNKHDFTIALEKFKRIEAYPNSKAYPYGLYKSAWCLYNLKQTDEGVQQLLIVVKNNPADSQDEKKYNLRKEALRDLTLFVGETLPPEQLYPFFAKITTENELGEVIINLSGLYESHSRFKEISIFVKEFIENHPKSDYTAKSYAKLIDTNETLKQRDVVISNMKKMSDHCDTEPTTTCKDEFRKISLEISKKWWEIWLKNKKHVEFSKLTEQAFEILLDHEDPSKPDSLSRFAYAELLFQQEKFELASKNYEEVSNHKGLDKTKSHDALYGALYSLEKVIDSKKEDDPSMIEKQKQLATRYIHDYANGEHIETLQFKLGFIAYKQQDLDNALKLLQPFTQKAKNKELRVKAEDIVLDIYNIKKDYVAIQNFALSASKGVGDDKRKKALGNLVEEANYSQIQTDSSSMEASKKIELLKQFALKHKDSKLSQDALWQSISLAYSNGFEVLGAELSLNYAQQFPQDKRNLDSVKEAAKAFIEAGQLKKAISTIRELARLEPAKGLEHLEMSCDLLRVNSQLPEARGCYKALYEKADKERKPNLLAKLMKSFKDNKNTSELESIENEILKDNIEPYATQILIDKSKKLLEDKKYTEAFNLSMRANSRPVDGDIRAEARLIQAQVLEREFVNQSVKARESKFAMVLSMKAERLDKAFTAYSTTIKMSKNDRIQAQALQGIDRLYGHFIEAITNMPVPESLTPDEQKQMREELVNMTNPFKQKRADNLAKLRQVSKLSTAESEEVNWAEFSVEKTVEPRIKFPSVQKIGFYLPSQFDITSSAGFSRLPAQEKKCDSNTVTPMSIGGCLQSKKFADAEKIAFKLTETKEKRAIGLYYLSVIADAAGESDKALWMIEKASALESDNSLVIYQKGKILYSVEGINSALPYFEKVLDMKKNSTELVVMSALKSFSDRDFITATEEFSRLSTEELYNYDVALLVVEAQAQKGESAEAIKLAQRLVNVRPSNVDMYIELARVFEHFALDKENAVASYQKALAKSAQADQRDWIKKKIEFLKTSKNSQISSNVGG